MSLRARRRALAALCLIGAVTLCGGALAVPPFRIVIDPGHTSAQGGALGVRGVYEVEYNDKLADRVHVALESAGFDAELTRAPGHDISLGGRAEFANAQHADLFLALHHDSAQPRYLEKIQVGSQPAYRTIKPIAGYSLFVSQRNPHFDQSYAFAKLLGEQMHALGRPPSLHHAEPIEGENRELLDPTLGIYRYDNLLVLHQTQMPAVLMETGVIVDPTDEAYVSDEGSQRRIAQAVTEAVRRYVAELKR